MKPAEHQVVQGIEERMRDSNIPIPVWVIKPRLDDIQMPAGQDHFVPPLAHPFYSYIQVKYNALTANNRVPNWSNHQVKSCINQSYSHQYKLHNNYIAFQSNNSIHKVHTFVIRFNDLKPAMYVVGTFIFMILTHQ